MKTVHTSMATLLAAAGFVLTASFAYAQPGDAPCGYGGGPGMGRWGAGAGPMAWGGGPGARGYGPGAGPVANADARLAFLKEQLKITADQETAWDAYAAQVRQQAGEMLAMHARMANSAQRGPDFFAQRAELMKQRVAGMEATSAAMKDLYAVLTTEQKAIADQHFGGWRMTQYGGPRGSGPRGYGPRW